MKMFKKGLPRVCAALVLCAALAVGMAACSNSSDNSAALLALAGTGQTQNSVTKYTVTISSEMTNGSVTADKTSAAKDETVTLTISPASDYKLDALTVTAEGGASVAVSGTGGSRTFTMPAKNVTVTATFAAIVVTFGLWPQTIKVETVTVNEGETKTAGDFTYCRGSDGEWYAKIKERACESGYKYSDGTAVAQSSADSYKWFKVEPIKWRILTTNYNGTGKKLLLSEKILIEKRYDASSNNYQNSEIRKWLNSNANSEAASDHNGAGGFLKTAFTADEIASIAATSVDNSARSTNPDANATEFYSGANQYASDTPTTDKVFLLSEQEVTTSAYGFDAYNASGAGNKRIRVTTDYAKASGAEQNAGQGFGGRWWTRSPSYEIDGNRVYYVFYNGYTHGRYVTTNAGVAPALSIAN